jgi:hypothetical protein
VTRHNSFSIIPPEFAAFDLHQQWQRACVLIVTASSNTSADFLWSISWGEQWLNRMRNQNT